MTQTGEAARLIVDVATRKASTMLLGAVAWSIGLGILNTVLLIALIVLVAVS